MVFVKYRHYKTQAESFTRYERNFFYPMPFEVFPLSVMSKLKVKNLSILISVSKSAVKICFTDEPKESASFDE